jgi:hypothetical protein
MSSSGGEQEQIRAVAERIARRLSSAGEGVGASSAPDDEVAALRASLAELQQRLAQVESHVGHDAPRESSSRGSELRRVQGGQNPQAGESNSTPTRSLWLSGTYVPAAPTHPSEERFGIGEAVSEIVDFFEREKSCTVEPGGKPCDHCAMCSSRGF